MTNRNLLKMCKLMMLLLLSAIGSAQQTPQGTWFPLWEKTQPAQTQQIGRARSEYVSEADTSHVLTHCGPSWMGGCWDYSAPHPSNGDVLKSPLFIWPTVAEWSGAAFDIGITWRGLQEHKCVEGNPIYGQNPSLKDLALTNLAAHAGITAMRFVILKAIPTNSASKWRRLPQVVAVAGGFGSAALQVKSGLRWYQDGCL